MLCSSDCPGGAREGISVEGTGLLAVIKGTRAKLRGNIRAMGGSSLIPALHPLKPVQGLHPSPLGVGGTQCLVRRWEALTKASWPQCPKGPTSWPKQVLHGRTRKGSGKLVISFYQVSLKPDFRGSSTEWDKDLTELRLHSETMTGVRRAWLTGQIPAAVIKLCRAKFSLHLLQVLVCYLLPHLPQTAGNAAWYIQIAAWFHWCMRGAVSISLLSASQGWFEG